MTENNSNKKRRKLLKSIAAGSGAVIAGKSLPESWSRPVVDAVMLPAHAQTSNTYSGATSITLVSLDSGTLMAQALDSLVPEAAADFISFRVSWCVIPVNATQADVNFLVSPDVIDPPYADIYTGRATVGVETLLPRSEGCSNKLGANAADWLNKSGLVKDALAICSAKITLSGLNTGDPFVFSPSCVDVFTLNDVLKTGSSCPSAIFCTLI